mmetsp:Transcript_27426/g.88557  ORF Transcript_27426/g.88557 Transcript_27426/m.88557 type:complete len:385 (-) Transcript_27426:376-1530(-)
MRLPKVAANICLRNLHSGDERARVATHHQRARHGGQHKREEQAAPHRPNRPEHAAQRVGREQPTQREIALVRVGRGPVSCRHPKLLTVIERQLVSGLQVVQGVEADAALADRGAERPVLRMIDPPGKVVRPRRVDQVAPGQPEQILCVDAAVPSPRLGWAEALALVPADERAGTDGLCREGAEATDRRRFHRHSSLVLMLHPQLHLGAPRPGVGSGGAHGGRGRAACLPPGRLDRIRRGRAAVAGCEPPPKSNGVRGHRKITRAGDQREPRPRGPGRPWAYAEGSERPVVGAQVVPAANLHQGELGNRPAYRGDCGEHEGGQAGVEQPPLRDARHAEQEERGRGWQRRRGDEHLGEFDYAHGGRDREPGTSRGGQRARRRRRNL